MSSQEVKTGFMLRDVTQGLILQQVNCQGRMGSGIALAIKTKWPIVEEKYLEFCRGRRPHTLLGDFLPVQVEEKIWVGNMFGQEYFGKTPGGEPGGRYTSYDALDLAALKTEYFLAEMPEEYQEIHYPTVGCGLGGANWSIVSAIFCSRFDTIKHTLWEYPLDPK